MRDDGEVRGVDKRDDEWYHRVSTMVFRVGEDSQFSESECQFCQSQIELDPYELFRKVATVQVAPISPATSESNPEKMIAQSLKPSGLHSWTMRSRAVTGIGDESFHLTAALYA